MIRLLARRCAFAGVACALTLLVSCSQDSGAKNFSSLLNQGALEMLNGHSSERIVIYHPDSGAGQYTLLLQKHFPCASDPCDAPSGQHQGELQLTSKGVQQAGTLERWVSVPQQFEVTRKDQDTAVILQNKVWYAEVRAVY